MASQDRTAVGGRAEGASMIEISREERDVLRGEVVLTISGIADLSLHADNGGAGSSFFKTRSRMAAAVWLLDDLGWEEDDPREVFFITLPGDWLVGYLREIERGTTAALVDLSRTLANPRDAVFPVDREDPGALALARMEAKERIDIELETKQLCKALLSSVATDG